MQTNLYSVAQMVALDIDAEVDYWPEFGRREISSEKLLVVPAGVTYTRLSRATVATDYILHIGLLRRVTEDDVPGLVERLQTLGKKLLDKLYNGFRCVSVVYDPLYAVNLLRERRQFTGIIKVTLRGIEG